MAKDFAGEVMSDPGGEKILACMQCGTCTGSCPVSHNMQYTPRKLIALIRANQREKVLSSLDIWKCVSCYTCTARCPRGIKFTDIMYILKNLAWNKEEKGTEVKEISAFYDSFQKLIESRGRMNESQLVFRYSFRTNPIKLLEFAPMGLKLMSKGRVALLSPGVSNRKQVQTILKMAGERRGA